MMIFYLIYIGLYDLLNLFTLNNMNQIDFNCSFDFVDNTCIGFLFYFLSLKF